MRRPARRPNSTPACEWKNWRWPGLAPPVRSEPGKSSWRATARSSTTSRRYIAKESSAARELADSLYADLYGTTTRDGQRISKLASYTGRGSLEGWLRTVMAQEFVNRFRRQRRLVSLDEESEDGAQFAATDSDACRRGRSSR